ncbi:uncharacterized protein LOC131843344 [Achroia grisella]|uniref:uncharacterized protein LOC131843344 n=1 Tax=Achroia grisella TaxID=688607 RepID=UPI0027D29E47|nr:uncharacterized protein LOC131843344 [Achroia grisella]
MAHEIEPMDIDNIESDFDNKENSFHHSNVLPRTPCTEKGYEELDVSELNMKLRYSMTPASSPMSKSYTANCADSKNVESISDLGGNNNLTRSYNSMIKSENMSKSLKLHPLQVHSSDQSSDNNRNVSVLRQLDTTVTLIDKNVTVTVTGTADIDENISLPSSSSSTIETPEATTPTKEIPKHDGGSPIMRGLKSVLNMFRSSQSPISTEGDNTAMNRDILSPVDGSQTDSATCTQKVALASTPIATKRNKDGSSKRSSPLKDSIVFNDDLEKELLWKDETTILFSEEKIPIHKLFYQQSQQLPSLQLKTSDVTKASTVIEDEGDNINSTVEYMDVSCADSLIDNKTMADFTTEPIGNQTESDNEFVDCETSYPNNESELLNDTDLNKTLDNLNIKYGVSSNNTNIHINTQMDLNLAKELTTNVLKESIERLTSNDYTENIEMFTDNNIIVTDISNSDEIDKETLTEEDYENQSRPIELKFNTEMGNSSYKNLPSENINDNINPGNLDSPSKMFENNINHQNDSHMAAKDMGQSEEQFNNKISNDSVSYAVSLESEDGIITSITAAKNTSLNSQPTQLQENISSNGNTLSERLHDCEVNVDIEPNISKDDIHSISNMHVPVGCSLKVVSENVLSDITVDNLGPDTVLQNVAACTVTENILKSMPLGVEDNVSINIINADTNLPVDIPLPEDDLETEESFSDQTLNENIALQSNLPPDVISDLNTNTKIENAVKFEGLPTESVNKSLSTANFIKCDDNEQQNILQKNEPVHKEISTIYNSENENELVESFAKKSNELNSLKENEVIKEIKEDEPDLIEIKKDANDEFVTLNSTSIFQNTTYTQEEENLTDIHIADQSQGQITQNIGPIMSSEHISQEVMQKEKILRCNTSITDNNESVNCEINVQSQDVNVTKEKESPDQKYTNSNINSEPESIDIVNTSIDKKYTIVENSMTVCEGDIKNGVKRCSFIAEKDIETLDEKYIKGIEETKDTFLPTPDKHVSMSDTIVHEELLVSENNSPYVLISVDNDLEIMSACKIDELDKIENPFTINTKVASPPISPKITSNGYNLNFDDMDDPFATKTKIRVSPPLDSPKELVKQTIIDVSKNKIDTKGKIKFQPENHNQGLTKMLCNLAGDNATSSLDNQENLITSVNIDNSNDIKNFNSTICTVDMAKSFKNEIVMEQATNDKPLTVKIEDNLIKKSEVGNDLDNLSKTPDPSTVGIDSKSPGELNKTSNECKDTSSSEQSIYLSAATSSGESITSRNVFNIPEIDSINPFVTKIKMCQSPQSDTKMDKLFENNENVASIESSSKENAESQNYNLDDESKTPNVSSNIEEKEHIDVSNTTCSSKTTDDKNITVREVHTDEEDTIEGPFLEADDLNNDKLSDFIYDNADMIHFTELPPQANDDLESGELFIDAEAFEFLLNQNKRNVVSDSGKESLFLKFDPLFAKRMSSDGMLAALNKIQKRQSTPKKMCKPVTTPAGDIPIAGPSTLNVKQSSISEDVEDVNITTSKPMMVVTPAVNSIVSPRKSATPTISNRRSLTFTSPAIAVIDRLLSLSANNSLNDHDTSAVQIGREQNEADLVLTQLRELLAEKEISVYNLRSESKELKNRLSNLETHMQTLESECDERLKKINDLTDKLSEKTKINRSMASVVEEYERTIASLIAETEQDKKNHNEERLKLIKERDEQTAHLASMEVSFSDLHSKYEKSKQIILTCKANEDTYKKSIKEFEENLIKMQNNYELLKQHATSKLNHANQELEKMNRAHEAEVLKLNAMIKRKELHITSLEETLTQKTKANEELTAICDELINKVG